MFPRFSRGCEWISALDIQEGYVPGVVPRLTELHTTHYVELGNSVRNLRSRWQRASPNSLVDTTQTMMDFGLSLARSKRWEVASLSIVARLVRKAHSSGVSFSTHHSR